MVVVGPDDLPGHRRRPWYGRYARRCHDGAEGSVDPEAERSLGPVTTHVARRRRKRPALPRATVEDHPDSPPCWIRHCWHKCWHKRGGGARNSPVLPRFRRGLISGRGLHFPPVRSADENRSPRTGERRFRPQIFRLRRPSFGLCKANRLCYEAPPKRAASYSRVAQR